MTSADVIVIGGGIAGVGAAAEIARDRKVILLEAEPQLGYHSTGRSAAIFVRNYGNATLRTLNAMSQRLFDDPGDIAEPPLLKPRGLLLLATKAERDALDDYAAGSDGLQRLTAREAAALVPILRPEPIDAALYEEDAQDIEVDRLLTGYRRLCLRFGGAIVVGARVTALQRKAGRWEVRAGAQVFSAPVIVNAAGAWAGEVARMAGAQAIRITPKRRSAAILPAPPGMNTRAWPGFGSVAETWYAKPDAGRLMVSPADEDPVAPQDAWPDDMVLAEGLHRYARAVTTPVTRVERSWAGLRSFADDKTPVVGEDTEAEGCFWLAGQGGYGVQTAPALSRIIANLVTGSGQAIPGEVQEALSPARFVPQKR